MSELRAKLIRLAHSKPELRKDLLPLLTRQAGCGSEALPDALRANCEEKQAEGEAKKKKEAHRNRLAGSSHIEILLGYGSPGYRVVYPDPYNQTYDSCLIGHLNPKTVIRLGTEALTLLQRRPNLDKKTVVDFVNQYVAEKSNGKWTRVSWNCKSYPD